MKKIPFSSSHHNLIEEDVNIYAVPPVLNRNTEREDSCVDFNQCM